ncbi:MAG: hypothetical protein DMF64_03295 [Acidobacteria bacterium]|nr:MAG: hypothetical protein DMF64_03295 [Acidobacteriota bacterium]
MRKRRHYINDNTPSVTTKYAIERKKYSGRIAAPRRRADNSRQLATDIRRRFPKFWMPGRVGLTQKTRPFYQNVEAFRRTTHALFRCLHAAENLSAPLLYDALLARV